MPRRLPRRILTAVELSDQALLERALAAQSPVEVFETLEPLRAKIGKDRDIAETWLTLLQASPSRRSLRDEVQTVFGAFPDDEELACLGLRALLRSDERRGPDEPAPADAPSRLVLALGAAWLARAERDASPRRAEFHVLMGNAHRRLGAAHEAEAMAHFERALALDPGRGDAYFDLGLAYKWSARFEEAADAFDKAAARLGRSRAVLFNLAVCATARGDGAAAAAIWRELGHRVEIEAEAVEGTLPTVLGPMGEPLDPVLVRVPSRDAGHASLGPLQLPHGSVAFELVGLARLSPCHGVVRTPTARAAVVDYGDLVLFDPAPVTTIRQERGVRTVHPLLGVLVRGDERRFAFLALEQEEGGVADLGRGLPEGCLWYLHDVRVDRVCPRCAAGDTFRPHRHERPEERRAVRGKLVVPAKVDLAEVERALSRAKGSDVSIAMPALYEHLGLTAEAGRHHKRWGAIERGLLARSTSGRSEA